MPDRRPARLAVPERVREAFADTGSFWLASVPAVGARRQRLRCRRPQRFAGFAGTWARIRPVRLETAAVGPAADG